MLIESDPDFFRQVVRYDESWVHYFNPLTQRRSLTWKSTTSPKTKKCDNRLLLEKSCSLFFRLPRSCLSTFCPSEVKGNALYCCHVLTNLHDHGSRRRPEKKNTWMLHDDKARPHYANIIKEFFYEKKIRTIRHPP